MSFGRKVLGGTSSRLHILIHSRLDPIPRARLWISSAFSSLSSSHDMIKFSLLVSCTSSNSSICTVLFCVTIFAKTFLGDLELLFELLEGVRGGVAFSFANRINSLVRSNANEASLASECADP